VSIKYKIEMHAHVKEGSIIRIITYTILYTTEKYMIKKEEGNENRFKQYKYCRQQ